MKNIQSMLLVAMAVVLIGGGCATPQIPQEKILNASYPQDNCRRVIITPELLDKNTTGVSPGGRERSAVWFLDQTTRFNTLASFDERLKTLERAVFNKNQPVTATITSSDAAKKSAAQVWSIFLKNTSGTVGAASDSVLVERTGNRQLFKLTFLPESIGIIAAVVNMPPQDLPLVAPGKYKFVPINIGGEKVEQTAASLEIPAKNVFYFAGAKNSILYGWLKKVE